MIWSETDKQYLKANIQNYSIIELAAYFKRSDAAVEKMAYKLMLHGKFTTINRKKSNGDSVARKTEMHRKNQGLRVFPGSALKATKPFTSEGKKLVRVDERTQVYVPDHYTEEQIAEVISKYKK